MTAKKTAEKFLQAWIAQDYVAMLDCTQITWKANAIKKPSIWEQVKDWATGRSQKVDANNSLVIKTLQFDLKKVDEVNTSKLESGNPAVIKQARAKVKLADNSRAIIVFNIICETGAFNPDPAGKWGVNPTSIKFIE